MSEYMRRRLLQHFFSYDIIKEMWSQKQRDQFIAYNSFQNLGQPEPLKEGIDYETIASPEHSGQGCYVPSPLDAWRGTGRIAKQLGLSSCDNNAPNPDYAYDVAGNNVKVDWDYYEEIQRKRREDTIKYMATIKDAISLQSVYKMDCSEADFEKLMAGGIVQRPPSPCPCKSKECEDEYKKEISNSSK